VTPPGRGEGSPLPDPFHVELSVIAPCLDEEANVGELTRRVLATFDRGGFGGELVVVDDGSRDGTWAALSRLAREHPGRVVPIRHARNRGIAAAWQTGVAAARGDLVALIDADLQYQPEDLLRLRRELGSGAFDVVQGFRSPIGRERDARYHLSRGFNVLLNRTFGMRLRDNKSGFVMSPRAVMRDLLAHEGRYAYFQSFIMVAAHAKGYAYKDVETLFESRRAGVSFLENRATRVAAACLVDLGKAFWEYRVRRPEQHAASRVSVPAVRLAEPPRPRARRSPGREALWRGYMASFNRTHWVISRDVERYYESLERTQWLSLSEMGALQDEKLRRLVRHAYRTVPYYRERFRERGLTPDDVRGRADLHKLPFLTKGDVREHLYFDLLSERHAKSEMLRITTSGSTGEPFVCYADRAQLEFRWAATLRSQEWTGYRFGDRSVRLWHQNVGLSPAQAWRERLDARLSRRRFIPVFELAEDRLEDVIQTIADYEPVLVDGYAEALDFLATYVVARGASPFRPRAVMSSAQTLPEPSRRLIEQAFGCPVFDKYGAREFSGVAYECEAHAGYHVVSEGYVVEVLREGRPARPGEVGEIVITDLNNYAMPFVRYRIGDLAVALDPAAPCACGRGLPRLGPIQGRVQSIIQGTEGRYLPGTFFSHYLKEMHHAIRRFQVVQERPRHLTLRFVPAGRYTPAVLEEILATFRRYLGDDMAIDVEQVSEIEMVRTGKRLASVSRLPVDFQGGFGRR
jgi:phenylacetate-CoA ligase